MGVIDQKAGNVETDITNQLLCFTERVISVDSLGAHGKYGSSIRVKLPLEFLSRIRRKIIGRKAVP